MTDTINNLLGIDPIDRQPQIDAAYEAALGRYRTTYWASLRTLAADGIRRDAAAHINPQPRFHGHNPWSFAGRIIQDALKHGVIEHIGTVHTVSSRKRGRKVPQYRGV